MSKKQSDHLEFTRGDILGVDRSHTSALPMQNLKQNSHVTSFAAHKASKHDKTNASHNPGNLDWLDGPVGDQKRKKSKGKGAKEFESDMLEI